MKISKQSIETLLDTNFEKFLIFYKENYLNIEFLEIFEKAEEFQRKLSTEQKKELIKATDFNHFKPEIFSSYYFLFQQNFTDFVLNIVPNTLNKKEDSFVKSLFSGSFSKQVLGSINENFYFDYMNKYGLGPKSIIRHNSNAGAIYGKDLYETFISNAFSLNISKEKLLSFILSFDNKEQYPQLLNTLMQVSKNYKWTEKEYEKIVNHFGSIANISDHESLSLFLSNRKKEKILLPKNLILELIDNYTAEQDSLLSFKKKPLIIYLLNQADTKDLQFIAKNLENKLLELPQEQYNEDSRLKNIFNFIIDRNLFEQLSFQSYKQLFLKNADLLKNKTYNSYYSFSELFIQNLDFKEDKDNELLLFLLKDLLTNHFNEEFNEGVCFKTLLNKKELNLINDEKLALKILNCIKENVSENILKKETDRLIHHYLINNISLSYEPLLSFLFNNSSKASYQKTLFLINPELENYGDDLYNSINKNKEYIFYEDFAGYNYIYKNKEIIVKNNWSDNSFGYHFTTYFFELLNKNFNLNFLEDYFFEKLNIPAQEGDKDKNTIKNPSSKNGIYCLSLNKNDFYYEKTINKYVEVFNKQLFKHISLLDNKENIFEVLNKDFTINLLKSDYVKIWNKKDHLEKLVSLLKKENEKKLIVFLKDLIKENSLDKEIKDIILHLSKKNAISLDNNMFEKFLKIPSFLKNKSKQDISENLTEKSKSQDFLSLNEKETIPKNEQIEKLYENCLVNLEKIKVLDPNKYQELSNKLQELEKIIQTHQVLEDNKNIEEITNLFTVMIADINSCIEQQQESLKTRMKIWQKK